MIVATSPCYTASLGAMCDAHARLGEAFETNEALSSYSTMETRLHLAGVFPGPVRLAGGRAISADMNLEELPHPRIIYLPNFQHTKIESYNAMRGELRHFFEWLSRNWSAGVVIGACGNSVLHLAAAGLVNDVACAASPRLVSSLKALAPRIRIDTSAAIRHEGNIWTCSRDFDNPALVVRLVADTFSIDLGKSLVMREPSGPEAAVLSSTVDPVVSRAQLWMRDHFTKRFRISDLADELGLSHQALIRRFAASGVANPRQFVQKMRVDAAAVMLVETNRSVSEVGQLVGYSDIPSFRRIFRKLIGMTPTQYRGKARAEQNRHA